MLPERRGMLAVTPGDRVPAGGSHPGLPGPAQPRVPLPLPAEAARGSRPPPRSHPASPRAQNRGHAAGQGCPCEGSCSQWQRSRGGREPFRGDGVTALQGSPPAWENRRSHGQHLAFPASQHRSLQPPVLDTARAPAGGTGEGCRTTSRPGCLLQGRQGGRAPPRGHGRPAREGLPTSGGVFFLFNSPGFRGKRNLPLPCWPALAGSDSPKLLRTKPPAQMAREGGEGVAAGGHRAFVQPGRDMGKGPGA